MFGEGGLAVYFRVSPFFVERFGGGFCEGTQKYKLLWIKLKAWQLGISSMVEHGNQANKGQLDK